MSAAPGESPEPPPSRDLPGKEAADRGATPPPRPPQRRARAGGSRKNPLPVAVLIGTLCGFGAAQLLRGCLLPSPRSPVSETGSRGDLERWTVIGEGASRFLGAERAFVVKQLGLGERFRLESGTAAREDQRLDAALQSFLREALAGLRGEESLEISIARVSTFSAGAAAQAPTRAAWTLSLREAAHDGQTWYSFEGRPFEARTTEDLKERAAREMAREFATVLRGSVESY